ncbi:MAG: SDR family NAD(P)-dependent oxidoreductase [bacterium]|nr:SDR family NAD(P)-dependent oxidoreductase [bacterium]
MPPAYMSLENRTAVVTGAARGIGKAVAQRLAEAGARVAITDIDQPAAEAAASEIGSAAFPIELDVSNATSVKQGFDELLNRWQHIDILVNNAGIVGRDVLVRDLTEEDWDRVLDINLKGVFLCSRAAIASMIEQNQGAIVSVASISGKEGNPSMAPYSVSKAGIICFTKALAKEVVGHKIRVNCVAPALIETTITEGMNQQQIEYMASRIPMGRLGKPQEVAALVHFLVSDEASFTTGQCYDISGGRATY